MTKEAQVAALAELDGMYFGCGDFDAEECWRRRETNLRVGRLIPNYTTSYDAIPPVAAPSC